LRSSWWRPRSPARRSSSRARARRASRSRALRRGGHVEVSLPALEGGDRIQYERFADRPLVLNFFASWCPTCIVEMPAFERLHRELGDEVRFLGVAQSDARSVSIELVQRTGITYPAGIDPSGRFFNAWGTFGMPTTVVIRPEGHIAYVYAGGLDDGRSGRSKGTSVSARDAGTSERSS
jgi:thiol-disulfide isomerase/thioredoxin